MGLQASCAVRRRIAGAIYALEKSMLTRCYIKGWQYAGRTA